jgi:osmotically inducible lipoprotein OsmB
MRNTLISIAAVTAFMIVPGTLNAQERTFTGAAIGAGTGAVIAGPPGAVVGGVAGAVIGGPRVSGRPYARGYRTCWRDRYGRRHCRYR